MTEVQDIVERLAERLQAVSRDLLELSAVLTGQANSRPESLPEPTVAPETLSETVLQSVGHHGVVTAETALVKAQELGHFTRAQFAEALGLHGPGRGPDVARWLSVLTDRQEISFQAPLYHCLSPPRLRDWVIRQKEEFTAEQAVAACELEGEEELEDLTHRGIIERIIERDGTVLDGAVFRYVPPRHGPNEHETKAPPERFTGYDLAPERGTPVRKSASDRSNRRQRSVAGAGGINGPRARDRRHEAQERAKVERAEAQKSRAQRQPKWKKNK